MPGDGGVLFESSDRFILQYIKIKILTRTQELFGNPEQEKANRQDTLPFYIFMGRKIIILNRPAYLMYAFLCGDRNILNLGRVARPIFVETSLRMMPEKPTLYEFVCDFFPSCEYTWKSRNTKKSAMDRSKFDQIVLLFSVLLSFFVYVYVPTTHHPPPPHPHPPTHRYHQRIDTTAAHSEHNTY